MIDSAEELLAATADQAGDRIGDLRNRLSAAATAAKENYEMASEKAVRTAKATDRCVRDHPYQTIAVIFGVGLLLGTWFSRRS